MRKLDIFRIDTICVKKPKISSLEEWIQRLKDSGKTIIVEGHNDRKALEFFGIKGIVTLRKRPMYEIAESIKI